MKKKRMSVDAAKRLLKCKTYADLARALGTKYQNVQYWDGKGKGLPEWWERIVRGKI